MNLSSILLQFNPENATQPGGKPVRDGLSSVVKVSDCLWLACDEGIRLERLRKTDGGYAEHVSFDLNDYLTLPADETCEVDIEGIDFENHYIWITGSHSLKRKKPKKEPLPLKKQIKRLAKVTADPNRYVLARIPLLVHPETGEQTLHKSCPHPDDPGQTLTAATLRLYDSGNELMKTLAEDEHLKDFLKIPGKDNGFDIEGLALDGSRVFLGLRGPVLRGWAVVLEIEPENADHHTLQLKPIGPKNCPYKKHFLDVAGMGIRELVPSGNDLLLLAGPTMDLDGVISVFRWKSALTRTRRAKYTITYRHQIERLFDTPHGHGADFGKDKSEGMALLSSNELLIVYDSPAETRKSGNVDVQADVVKFSGRRTPFKEKGRGQNKGT